ncbi:MAG TPA: DinB family protein [Falsiroseomonas sp.]|jgi:hypothetical protein|nr:DinB family protein [Falsiroseomonas sp.]
MPAPHAAPAAPVGVTPPPPPDSAARPSLFSSKLEKILEARLCAELATDLWLRGIADFEVLRSEVDDAGYDLVLEANGCLRHIQLKASWSGAATAEVSVSTRLARKPSGCVVWMLYDPETLRIERFRWLGGAPGTPLPPLGDKVTRHTKGDRLGHKAERPGHRTVPKARFDTLHSLAELLDRLFGSFAAQQAGVVRREASPGDGEMRDADADLALLRRHLRAVGAQPGSEHPDWLRAVAAGELGAVPEGLRWSEATDLAHLVDGYWLAREAGLGEPAAFLERKEGEARRVGRWSGSALELWTCFFLASRRERFSGFPPAAEAAAELDALCAELRARLASRG